MARGGKRDGAGRPEGSTNKATQDARLAIAQFVEGNVDRLNGWLDQMAEENPKDAFDRFMSVIEYHVPKLARTELQPLGKDGKPADSVSKIIIEHVGVKK